MVLAMTHNSESIRERATW